MKQGNKRLHVDQHGIDRNASSLVPLRELPKYDSFANREQQRQTLMAGHTLPKGSVLRVPPA